MLFGFNNVGFVRLDKPILPGNAIEWVHVFQALDSQDSLGGVAIDAHASTKLIPEPTDVFLRQAIRQYPIRIPAPKRRKNPAGGVVRTRLLVESKTAEHRRENRTDRARTGSHPQADSTTILAFLTELNCNTRDGNSVKNMNNCPEDSRIFTSELAPNAMLDCRSVSGGELFLNQFEPL